MNDVKKQLEDPPCTLSEAPMCLPNRGIQLYMLNVYIVHVHHLLVFCPTTLYQPLIFSVISHAILEEYW